MPETIGKIKDRIIAWGADRVEVLDRLDSTGEIHFAVIKRPNPGRLHVNVKRELAKQFHGKRVILHINPKRDQFCTDTHILEKGSGWKRGSMRPDDGFIL